MKRGFSLVELMVVIGILAVLMSVAVPQIGKARESARAAQCMSNMRSLAQACYNAAMEVNAYPHAGSAEYADAEKVKGKTVYCEHKGWLSWQSGDYYAQNPTEHRSNENTGWNDEEEKVLFAITNGAIWRAIGGNRSCYTCPEVVRKIKGRAPGWTYAMNGFFKYDYSFGNETTDTKDSAISLNELERSDKILMFAELEMNGDGSGTSYEADGVLEYDDGTSQHQEQIGFHHKLGKKDCAHVVFADCHVERLVAPGKGDLKELTEWLCKGYDIALEEGAYTRIKESQDE